MTVQHVAHLQDINAVCGEMGWEVQSSHLVDSKSTATLKTSEINKPGFYSKKIYRKAHHLSHVLVDEDDINVAAPDESLQSLLDVGHGCVLVHHHEVRLAIFVELAHPAQQKAHAGVLVPDDSDQLAACRGKRHFSAEF